MITSKNIYLDPLFYQYQYQLGINFIREKQQINTYKKASKDRKKVEKSSSKIDIYV